MFKKAIRETTLTSEIAGRLFSNINAIYNPDQSFLATLRALLRNRLPQEETVNIICNRLHFSESTFRATATTAQRMELILPDTFHHYIARGNNIYIICAPNPEISEEVLEFVKDNVGKGKRYLSSYNQRDDLKVFYARKLTALFYTDDDNRNTIIFANKLELKHFHALQMMIPKYLPELFVNDPLTEAETALLKSTGYKSAVDYEALINEFAKDLDIRSEIIRIKLEGFETAYERTRLDELRNEIQRYQQDYENHLTSLRETSQKIQSFQYVLAGMEGSINSQSGDSELVEYFMCNKNLIVVRTSGTTLEFIAHGYVDIYDEEAFNQYVSNHNGYMYANLNSSITKPQMEALYRAIFNDGIYRLRICAAYNADMRKGLKAYQHYTFPTESKTYFPNPHIQQFGCIGTYAGRFQEYMQKKDYVGAIDQAVVSARNLNFYDSSVMSGFAKDFSRTTIKCLEKPDGTLLNLQEAIIELEGNVTCQDPLF